VKIKIILPLCIEHDSNLTVGSEHETIQDNDRDYEVWVLGDDKTPIKLYGREYEVVE